MSKVLIIGIDGFDPFLLAKYKESLPNLGRLFNDLHEIKIESTIPPDSICAWTSIYTGENPAEHGLIESIDYLSGKKSEGGIDRSANFRGKTFWDIASENKKRVCVINPFMAYPAWKVNGVMVSGPVFEGGTTSTYPEDILEHYCFPPLGGMVDFPDEKTLGSFLINTKMLTEQLADVGFRIYKDYRPDLFFLTFLTLDRVKHFLWRFTDPEDKDYPGKNPFEDSIKDFYMLFDRIIGSFLDLLDKDTALLVISDHGHGRRCSMSLNLNEILRQKGYLATTGNGAKGMLKKVVERTKVLTLSTLSRYDLQDWTYKIARFVPNRRALKKSTYLIDKESSSVTLSNLCGANPFGGIDVRPGKRWEYEKLRNDIISDLMHLNKSIGKNLVKWAKKREQVYTGKNETKLPDILFELDEDYGVGMDLYTKIITPNYTHKKVSGGHNKSAVLLVYSDNNKIKHIKRPASVIGIKDYIFNIFGS